MAKSKSHQVDAGGDFNANDYALAAQEHAASLASLYAAGRYVAVIYLSGLAAECLFRAFRAKKGLPFTSEHKLEPLAKGAGFPELIPSTDRARFGAALSDLIFRWRNNHRFRSSVAMHRFLRDLKAYRGIKGDFVKENARRLSEAALTLVNLGVLKWH